MGGAVKGVLKATKRIFSGNSSKKSAPAPAPSGGGGGGGGGGGDNGAAALAAERAKLEAERKAMEEKQMEEMRVAAENMAGTRRARRGRNARPLLSSVDTKQTLGSEQQL